MSDSSDVFLSDEAFALQRNEEIRADIISKITADKEFIKDNDRVKLVLDTLSASDKSAFGKSKARSQSKMANSQDAVADSVRAFMAMSSASIPTPVATKRNAQVTQPLTDAVPGETQIGQFPLTLDDLGG